MSDRDLVIFEKRFANWEIGYSMQLEDEICRLIDTHLRNADCVIVSKERVENGIDKIALRTDKIALRINKAALGLRSPEPAFMWCHQDLVWRLELQGKTLKKVLWMLQAPLDTLSKELRKRAEDAYKNGRINDALGYFLELEKKNQYDFTIHQSIGNIYLFYKKDPVKALDFYEKAAKCASKFRCYDYAGLAYLHIGLIYYLFEDFKDAYMATSSAIEITNPSPILYEAYYQQARHCALLGKYAEAIEHLGKAIERNRYYCIKADNEKDFDVMKERLRSFFKDLRDTAQSYAKSEIEKAEKLIRDAKVEIEKAEKLIRDNKSYKVRSNNFRSAVKELNEAKTFMERGSLFDCWDAITKAQLAQRKALDSTIELLDSSINYMYVQKHEKRIKFQEKGEKLALYSSILIFLLATFGIYSVIQILFPLPSRTPPGFYSLQAIVDIIPSCCFAGFIAIIAHGTIKKRWDAGMDSKLAKLENKISELKTKCNHFEIKKEEYLLKQVVNHS